MSVLQKALADEGMKLAGNNALPKEQRTVKDFQRLINAVRAAEAGVQDRLSESEAALNKALHENLILHDRVRVLEAENVAHRLVKEMAEVGSLTVADRTKLLEALRPAPAA